MSDHTKQLRTLAALPGGTDGTIISAGALTKDFGDTTGVFDLDLEVEPGVIFGFIGPSGSGKTTTVRLLNGLHAPSSGHVEVFGQAPASFSPATKARIGYMPQQPVLYPTLTVWENLNFVASIYGMPWRRKARLRRALEFVELADAAGKRLDRLSGGMQRRLSLAATLVHDPELIFLDEPTAGIDPVLRRHIWDHLGELRDEGRTLFVTTQYVGEAAYCDVVGVLVEGRLAMVDAPEALRRAAFGGEVVDLRTRAPLAAPAYAALGSLPVIQGRGPETIDDTTVRLVVADAGTAIPELLEWCAAHEIDVDSAEVFQPPFDDVFVILVEQLRASAEAA